jgi:hypothetical protein
MEARPSVEPAFPRLRRTVLLALAVPVLLIGILFALLAWQLRVVAEYDRWVAHTYEVIAGTWRLDKLVIDHESGLQSPCAAFGSSPLTTRQMPGNS